jgi:hypothetical protein
MAGSKVIYSRSSDLGKRRALQGAKEADVRLAQPKKVRAVLTSKLKVIGLAIQSQLIAQGVPS